MLDTFLAFLGVVFGHIRAWKLSRSSFGVVKSCELFVLFFFLVYSSWARGATLVVACCRLFPLASPAGEGNARRARGERSEPCARRAAGACSRFGRLTLASYLSGCSHTLCSTVSTGFSLKRASRSLQTQVLKFGFFLEHVCKVRPLKGAQKGPFLGPLRGSFWDDFDHFEGPFWTRF